MRVLAEFIMRGRAQAAVVSLLGSWLPLISPATVALVTLRRGSLDGSFILLWALLPALLTVWLSEGSNGLEALMTAAALIGLFVVLASSHVLRSRASWQQTLLSLVAFSTTGSLLVNVFIPDVVADATGIVAKMFADPSVAAPEPTVLVITNAYVIGAIAFAIAISGFFSVLLGRWWQALLYNPGGLQSEFHSLRLHPAVAAISALSVLYCWSRGLDYQNWGMLFGMPLMVASAALVHGSLKLRRMSGHWLIVFYLVLVFANILVMVLALLDSWIDFRSRIRKPQGPVGGDQ